ncbi:unnamed protein product [Vitrella brassicaformis CCMP3155]|uniref:GH16 domain-containing protein n=2 Tax=Vitrella brassicaformis TaxID=1169539 RepID=A0A0G4ESG9_VITBC|nr:unnamed protein product [Vitrella brassicaformis CCMP3155]|eukprot:CEM00815.1 unnamed protein product [Vitrella brassicaformis CCMP3155]
MAASRLPSLLALALLSAASAAALEHRHLVTNEEILAGAFHDAEKDVVEQCGEDECCCVGPSRACWGVCGREINSGEIMTRQSFFYGRFEATFRAAGAPGTLSTIFLLWPPSNLEEGSQWKEIDITIMGKGGGEELHTNVVTGSAWSGDFDNSLEIHKQDPPLADESSGDGGFHNYTVEWTPERLRWMVDDQLVREVEGDVVEKLDQPMHLHFSLWAVKKELAEWAGEFSAANLPLENEYRSVRIFSYDPESSSFSHEWTDDFSTFNDERWVRRTHTFHVNRAHFTADAVTVDGGSLTIGMNEIDGLEHVLTEDEIDKILDTYDCFEEDTDFDIKPLADHDPLGASEASPLSCAKTCLSTSGCESWSQGPWGCFLKGDVPADAQRVKRDNYVSGLRRCHDDDADDQTGVTTTDVTEESAAKFSLPDSCFEKGLVYEGGDLPLPANMTAVVSSKEQCAEACHLIKECVAFTFVQTDDESDQPECSVHDETASEKKVNLAGTGVSGRMACGGEGDEGEEGVLEIDSGPEQVELLSLRVLDLDFGKVTTHVRNRKAAESRLRKTLSESFGVGQKEVEIFRLVEGSVIVLFRIGSNAPTALSETWFKLMQDPSSPVNRDFIIDPSYPPTSFVLLTPTPSPSTPPPELEEPSAADNASSTLTSSNDLQLKPPSNEDESPEAPSTEEGGGEGGTNGDTDGGADGEKEGGMGLGLITTEGEISPTMRWVLIGGGVLLFWIVLASCIWFVYLRCMWWRRALATSVRTYYQTNQRIKTRQQMAATHAHTHRSGHGRTPKKTRTHHTSSHSTNLGHASVSSISSTPPSATWSPFPQTLSDDGSMTPPLQRPPPSSPMHPSSHDPRNSPAAGRGVGHNDLFPSDEGDEHVADVTPAERGRPTDNGGEAGYGPTPRSVADRTRRARGDDGDGVGGVEAVGFPDPAPSSTRADQEGLVEYQPARMPSV